MVTMLVTRPEPDASETARRLNALDIETVIDPLLRTETLPTSLPAATGFAAIAVTSANALRALEARGELPNYRNLPLYAVGDRTADMARHLGFARVSSAGSGPCTASTTCAPAAASSAISAPAAA